MAPHLPKTQPPTFLPMPMPAFEEGSGPSLFRGPRFWLAMVEYKRERFSVLVSMVFLDKVPWAVAVHGVSSGPTDPAPPGVEKRGEDE